MQRVLMDLGNSRVKYAVVDEKLDCTDSEQQTCLQAISVANDEFTVDDFSDDVYQWLICSVNRQALDRVITLIKSSRPQDNVRVITFENLPVSLAVDEPHRVGTDRVCAAVGANRLCDSRRDAIVVDAGTAVTIDVIDKNRTFLGGVIFPGISVALGSLQSKTSQLPVVDLESGMQSLDSAIGKSTEEAIRKGVLLSHAGAIESIVAKLLTERSGQAEVFVTGGDAELVVPRLTGCRHVRDLVLRGLSLAMDEPK